MHASRTPVGYAYLLLLATLALLFWPLLVGTHSLAFRDSAHFYTPLYDYVACRQSEQWLPLWNPLDLTGMPLLGETSTAVLYPPRILVYQLAPTPSIALSWYVVLHLVLAGLAAHLLAIASNLSIHGRAVTVLTYPLAGPIFFLIYNPPFLVSAAWLPVLCAAYLWMIQPMPGHRLRRSITLSALATAMMISAGDPQTALHAWMLIGAHQLLRWLAQTSAWQRNCRDNACLMVSALLAACLVAPQVAASIDWTRHSDRVHFHASENLQFHVRLYHWLEFLSPFVSGQIFPTHTRITQALYPGERDWTMTLYGGTAVMLLALMALQTHNRKRSLPWVLLFMSGLLLAHPTINQWLIHWLPGYQLFRYPAKWLPFASLGLVMLAAQNVDTWIDGSAKIKRTLLLFMFAAGLTSLIAFTVVSWASSESVPSSRIWGPFEFKQARTGVYFSLVQTFVVLGAMACSWRCRSATVLIVVLAVDLGVTAWPQRLFVRNQDVIALQQLLRSPNEAIAPGSAPENGSRGVRTVATDLTPRSWRTTSSPELRALENYSSERMTYFGRWHLADGQPLFNAPVTIRPQRIDQFWNSISDLQSSLKPAERVPAWLAIYRWLGIDQEWIVAPSVATIETGRSVDLMHIAKQKKLSDSNSLVQWSHRWRPMEPQRWIDRSLMDKRLSGVIGDSAVAHQPLVESASGDSTVWLQDVSPMNLPLRIDDAVSEFPQADLKIVQRSPERLTVQIHSTHPGWLTFKTFQDGNWHATIRDLSADAESDNVFAAMPLTLYRTDFFFLGAEVDAGDWQIEWVYRPWWLWPSVAIAIGSWGILTYLWFSKPRQTGLADVIRPRINPTTIGPQPN